MRHRTHSQGVIRQVQMVILGGVLNEMAIILTHSPELTTAYGRFLWIGWWIENIGSRFLVIPPLDRILNLGSINLFFTFQFFFEIN